MHVLYLVTFVVTIYLNVVPFSITTATPESIIHHRYMVSIHVNNTFCCAGSLVSKYLVITAAQSLIGAQPESIVIRSFSTYVDRGGNEHNVIRIHRHPKFDNDKLENDICLLLFEGNIPFYSKDDHTILPQPGAAVRNNFEVQVLGFGGNGRDIRLESVKVLLVNNQLCDSKITEKQFCAENTNTLNFTDVGGPVLDNGIMIGITSYRFPGRPCIYTKVSEYIDFIHDIFKTEDVTTIG